MDAAQERERSRRGSSQKSMLSKALQKANTAVLLDNAANYEGAIDAYSDACDLLMQVMRRTDGGDEKQKLEEIRTTYTTRITELRRLGLSSRSGGKALPERPLSDESLSPSAFSFRSDVHDELDEDDPYVIETATATRILNNPSYMTDPSEPRTLPPSQIPPRRQSLLPSAFDDEVRFSRPKKPSLLRAGSSSNLPTLAEQLDESSLSGDRNSEGNAFHHQSPSRDPPLPPRTVSQQSEYRNQLSSHLQPDFNNESTSWLDNGDSGGSSASSLRSRSSSLYLRKRDRMASGGTEAAFDAALDAAVEAAYDEGLEPADDSDDMSAEDDIVLNVRRNVERAKQKVREAEMEAEAISAKERETRRIQEEAFHEMMDVFDFDLQSKSALPRQTGHMSPSLTTKDVSTTGFTAPWQNTEPKSAFTIQRLKYNHAAAGSAESLPIQSPVAPFPDLQADEDEDDSMDHRSSGHTVSKVASAPDTLRKDTIFSQSKSARGKQLSISTEDTGRVPESPLVSAFPASMRKGPHMSVSTAGSPSVGAPHHIFDGTFHSAMAPGCPDSSTPNPPAALEPCPQSFLLRPFWLMRCIYQSITHPRGAYLTTKLFVPRDVWRVKNVKLKAVEEKISNCDLLTAALLKVAQVDTNDADAVLEEMQSLDTILDQVQLALSKKLGNEVGVNGAMHLFKSASSEDSSTFSEQSSRSSSGGSRSYLTPFRKLRSKSSGPNAGPSTSATKEASKDNLTMHSLPMNTTLNLRAPKRNLPELKCTGPNANYMNALARLCDAAQVLDQIARQVEDPGLKHTSETQVGLELCARHAAEFFGFYVCRFALNDIGLMIDKFIKRGSEWVLV
ncbi:hypothetical protein CIRG_01011 [Coccidioides immitis RMSCC 2394]|uniref:MIT domain-containing protein n=1 Tax=Coccidioides immitis RMSCC 2394 TaxID=404692 RepID=A0A0J6Y1J3_COCIT|nr:hypothetical protein CIRG_01011 [Coccidioides immitis RMSCC 2394]